MSQFHSAADVESHSILTMIETETIDNQPHQLLESDQVVDQSEADEDQIDQDEESQTDQLIEAELESTVTLYSLIELT